MSVLQQRREQGQPESIPLVNDVSLRICTPVGVEEDLFPVAITEANKIKLMLSPGLDSQAHIAHRAMN